MMDEILIRGLAEAILRSDGLDDQAIAQQREQRTDAWQMAVRHANAVMYALASGRGGVPYGRQDTRFPS